MCREKSKKSIVKIVTIIALIVFGIMTIQGSRTASLTTPGTGSAANPYMAGFLTSAANPYFWIWWLSVGSAMVIAAAMLSASPSICAAVRKQLLARVRSLR